MKNTVNIAPHILEHLSRDTVMKKLIESCRLKARPGQPSVYEALLRSIVFQQLSGASASTIHRRFLDLFPNQFPDPVRLMELSEDELRQSGLSRQKAGYVQNTARFFLENDLLKAQWSEIPDQDIIEQLTQIKGVGKWTVEMILMFTLNRPDVFPLDDLVIKSSMITLYDLGHLKGRALNQNILEIASTWQPYRTTASRYLWQSRDTII